MSPVTDLFTDVIYFNRQRAVFALVMSTPLLVRSTLLEGQNERKRQNNISNYGCDLLQPTARGAFPCNVYPLACQINAVRGTEREETPKQHI